MKQITLKQEIENELDDLKSKGYTRDKIEEELGYSENYIDQQLSKGGNNRFLNAIKGLNGRVLQKAIQPEVFTDRSLNNLTESNKVLSDANRTLAEANKTLAEANYVISKNHEELIQLTKLIVSNTGIMPRSIELPTPGTPGTETLKRKKKPTH